MAILDFHADGWLGFDAFMNDIIGFMGIFYILIMDAFDLNPRIKFFLFTFAFGYFS